MVDLVSTSKPNVRIELKTPDVSIVTNDCNIRCLIGTLILHVENLSLEL